MVLVDTSVWVDFLRGLDAPHVNALRNLLASDIGVGLAPPILQELLQGAATRERFAAWRRRFGQLPCHAPADSRACAIDAAELFLRCRMNGKTPRSSNDCLIAQIAIEHGLALMHNDRDFDAIASVDTRLRIHAYAGKP